MSTKTKSIINRFLKGMLAGVVPAIGAVQLVQPTSWSEIPVMLSNLGLALVYGAITGLVLALLKYVDWKE